MLDNSMDTLTQLLFGVLCGMVLGTLAAIRLHQSWRAREEAARESEDQLWDFMHKDDQGPLAQYVRDWHAEERRKGFIRRFGPEPAFTPSIILGEIPFAMTLLFASGLVQLTWWFVLGSVLTFMLALSIYSLARQGRIPARLPGIPAYFLD